MPHKSSEGSEEQRRAKAREARAEGKRPSEMGASTGASKQTKHLKSGGSHQERMDLRNEGKEAKGQKSGSGTSKPRPGNRDTDPSRNKRGGSSGVSKS